MSFPPTIDEISKIMGSPKSNVKQHWPNIYRALSNYQNATPIGIAFSLGTMAAECATFAPIDERASDAYFVQHYWDDTKVRRNLGNLKPEQAITYHGRGFIQLTGRYNYWKYGKALDIPLLENPDLAKDPLVAAMVFALFLHDHGVYVWAIKATKDLDKVERERAWEMTRRLVNGGLNGYPRYRKTTEKFLHLFQLS